MPKPELSVIIPAHNEELTIGGCLQSVIGELLAADTVVRSELIVVASACRDNTAQTVQSVFSDQVDLPTTLVNLKVPGKKLALNSGLEIACGDMVLCVDADVQVTAGSVMRAHGALHEQGARLVGGQYKPVIDGSWINKKPAPSPMAPQN